MNFRFRGERLFTNFGAIYDSQGQLDTALDYFQRALIQQEQVGNPVDIALYLHNIGSIYDSQKQWGDALPLFLRALSLYEKMGKGFESNVADELKMIAFCYLKLEEIEKVRLYYERAENIRERLSGSTDS